MPDAYLAFTQLAADNQHAALGLLLIGVQAQIGTALDLVLGGPAHRRGDAAAAAAALTAPDVVRPRPSPDVDLGVAVSRSELPSRDAGDKAARGAGGPSSGGLEVVEATKKEGGERKRKTKKRKKGDEFDDLFSSLI